MKKLCVLLMVLVLSMSAIADIYNPCDNLNDFTYGAFAEGDIGIHATGGTDGGTSVYFIPRDTGPHAITWNFADTYVKPGNTISFDIKNDLTYGAATLSVWIYYNNAEGEAIYCPANVDGVVLSTSNYVHFTIQMPVFECTITRAVFVISESTKIIDIDNLKLMTSHPGDVDKGPFHNPCTSLDEFTYGAFAEGDIGVHPTAGPDGSSSVYWVPRDAGPHAITWDFTDVTVNPGDTFNFDIKNVLALEPATLTVWMWLDNGSGGENPVPYCPPQADSVVLNTNNWVHFAATMPSGKVRRITFTINENTKVLDIDNLELVPGEVQGTGLYQYGPIYNPCDVLTDLILPVYDSGYTQEGSIITDLNGNHVRFIAREYNSHGLSWNIADFNVTSDDFMTFDIKNDMVYGVATLNVNLFWQNSTTTGVWGAEITGLANGKIDSAGWKHCRAAMPPFPCTITNISFVIEENTKIVTMDNLAISPDFIPQNCDQVKQAGLGLIGDISGDCHVDMNDVEKLAMDWLKNTDPNSPSHVEGTYEPTGEIVRGTATVDGSIAEWSNQVEWIPLNKVLWGSTTDVTEAKMALRWSATTNKIYAAIVVTDTVHFFDDEYIDWDTSDKIEVYSQGDAAGGAYNYAYSDIAQQYFVWHNSLATGGFSASWAGGDPLVGNPAPNFEYAVSISGNDLIYEVGVQMYDNYAGRLPSGDTIITNLAVGKVVGFDIAVDTRRGNGGDEFGMLAANTYENKATNASNFAQYTLVEQASCGMLGYLDGDVNGNCYIDFGDFSELASEWMQCNDPNDLSCTPNW